jgi:hypothetical protein
MKTEVVDDGDLRKYRTELPNTLDDSELSVYAFRLYAHLKRRAGDTGKCFEGARKMAEHCKMSPASVVNAKKELIEKGFITVKPGDKTTSTPDTIRIVNIWEQNFRAYQTPCSPNEQPCSLGEHPVHHTVLPCSPNDHPVHVAVHKKEQEEEGTARARDTLSLLSELQENPAYRRVNVEVEYHKMTAWCAANGKQATRRRFVNWLNRIEVLPDLDLPRGSPPVAAPDHQRQLKERYEKRGHATR